MEKVSDNQVLAVGKYSKGKFILKVKEEGKIKTIEYNKVETNITNERTKEKTESTKQSVSAYNQRLVKHNEAPIDVPDFMKKRTLKMQQERLRKEKGIVGAIIYNIINKLSLVR